MKKFIVGIALTIALPLQAAEIGVVDWRKALFSTNVAAEINQQLQQNFQPRIEEVQRLGLEIDKRREKLENDAPLMEEEELQLLSQELNGMMSTHNQIAAVLEQERIQLENQFLQQYRAEVDAGINQLVEKYNFELIIDKNSVVYFVQGNDVTEELRVILNDTMQ